MSLTKRLLSKLEWMQGGMRMHRRRNRWACAAAAVAVTGATLGSGVAVGVSTAGASSTPFRVLLIAASSTTYLKTNVQTETLLAKAAVTVVNKSGGVNGHKVVLQTANTNSAATTAVTKLESAENGSTKPNMVIFGNASPESSALLPIAKQDKVLTFNQAPTTTSGKASAFPYNFDLSPSTTNYVRAFVSYTKGKGAKKVAIFAGNDAYGTAIGKSMNKEAKADGLTVTDSVNYKVTALTFTSTLSALQSSKPQLVWADAYGAPAGYMMQDLQKIGWTVPVLGDDSFSVSTPITTPPPTGNLGTSALKNLKFQTVTAGVYKPPSQTPKNTQTMLDAMKRNGSPKASLLFGYEYDAVLMGVYAARKAGTLTTAAKMAKQVVAQQKAHSVPTGLFPSYGYTTASHFATVPLSSFSFVKPSKLITGQFGAPGSTAG
jgi:branched-chain amino acid transport system substrate-binding protein